MPGIFPFMREIVNGCREIRLLSDTYGYTPSGLESSTSTTPQLHLPEVWAPAQYLIDAGLQPALARRLSSTYMDVVNRYREACQSHFDRTTHGGHPTEYNREVFIILFKRTVQAWSSQIVSIARVQLCQARAPQPTVRPRRVDIRVDNATKAEIIARLGLKVTHLTSDKMVTRSGADLTSRLEEVSEQAHALSTDTVDSHLMLPGSRRYDPFGHVASQTCFPAPYPPPPRLPRNTLPTSFVSSTHPRVVRSRYNPDMSTLTNLFGQMTTATTRETNTRIPRNHGVFYVPNSNNINPLSPIPSISVADNSTKPQLTSVEFIASPTKPTNTPRRRKIASLPTRRGKTSASPSPSVFDSAGATSHPITGHPTERAVEVTPPQHVFASPQKTRIVSTPSLYTTDASCVAAPEFSTARQRKAHALHPMMFHQSQTIPRNQASRPLAGGGERFSYSVSRSPPLVPDATSYLDSPPTSSDELDTPPSTPSRSHVLLARTSTEDLAISSESDGMVSHKGPLGDAKQKQRYMRLDFTRGGWGRDEHPLTFTFGV